MFKVAIPGIIQSDERKKRSTQTSLTSQDPEYTKYSRHVVLCNYSKTKENKTKLTVVCKVTATNWFTSFL